MFKAGNTYANRVELHEAGIHRGLMRGIAPMGQSIVLSGGYVDDQDEGDFITYTGEGGRDKKTGRQIKDQVLSGGNQRLAENHTQGIPIRVTRGHTLDSPFAPQKGYRYDGLYLITRYWTEKGRDGFLVYRFTLERLPGQSKIGVLEDNPKVSGSEGKLPGNSNPERIPTISSRVVRITEVGNHVKKHYDYTCQACRVRLETPAGPYAEGCHVRPLGKPHNGPDTTDNVLCLCPNCHVLFDKHAITIDQDMNIIPSRKPLLIKDGHSIHPDHLKYRISISGKTTA